MANDKEEDERGVTTARGVGEGVSGCWVRELAQGGRTVALSYRTLWSGWNDTITLTKASPHRAHQ
jgi:hypothetical protein